MVKIESLKNKFKNKGTIRGGFSVLNNSKPIMYYCHFIKDPKTNVVEILILDSKNKIYTQQEFMDKNFSMEIDSIGEDEKLSLDFLEKYQNKKVPRVDANKLFKELKKIYKYFMDLPESQWYDYLALWTIHTYFYHVQGKTPYIFVSAEKGSGKTTLLQLIERLSFNSSFVINLTPAVAFRWIEAYRGTLVLDESEELRKDNKSPSDKIITNILKQGYKKAGTVLRNKAQEKQVSSKIKEMSYKLDNFEVFCPKVMATTELLDPILQTRCVTLDLFETTNIEYVNRSSLFDSKKWAQKFQKIREELFLLAMQNFEKFVGFETKTIFSKIPRVNELFLPIFSLSEILGIKANIQNILKNTEDIYGSIETGNRAVKYVLIALSELVDITLKETKVKQKSIVEKVQIIQTKEESTGEGRPNLFKSRGVGIQLDLLGFRKKAKGHANIQHRVIPTKRLIKKMIQHNVGFDEIYNNLTSNGLTTDEVTDLINNHKSDLKQ